MPESPESVSAHTDASGTARVAELERELSETPDTLGFYELAQAHWAAGRISRAGEVLHAGLQYHPEHLGARLLHGEALLTRGKFSSCAREMARLLQRDPGLVPAMILLGRSLLATHQIDEALVVLERAAETAPEDPDAERWLEAANDALRVAAQPAPAPAAEAVDEPARRFGIAEIRPDDGAVATVGAEDDAPAGPPAGLPALLPGFTGYIRAMAAPNAAFSGIESVPPLPARPSEAANPGRPSEFETRADSLDASANEAPEPLSALERAQLEALPFAADDDGPSDDDDDVTRAEDVPPSMVEDPAPAPPHPETGGATREALSPAFRPDAPPELRANPQALATPPANPRAFANAEQRPGGSLLLSALRDEVVPGPSSAAQRPGVPVPAGEDWGSPEDSIDRPRQPQRPAGPQPRSDPAPSVAPIHRPGPTPEPAASRPLPPKPAHDGRPRVALPLFDWEALEPPPEAAVAPTVPSTSVPPQGPGTDAPGTRDHDAPGLDDSMPVIERTHMTAPPEPSALPVMPRPQTVRLARKGAPAPSAPSIDETPDGEPASVPPMGRGSDGGRAVARSEPPRHATPVPEMPSLVAVLQTKDLMLEASLGPVTPPGGVVRARRAESGGSSEAERPRPAPPAPAQPPRTPVGASGERSAPRLSPLELLDTPFDPSEFADMPPKPKPVALHAPPPDLANLEASGERAVPQPPAPARRPPRPEASPPEPALRKPPRAPEAPELKPIRPARPAEPEPPPRPRREDPPARREPEPDAAKGPADAPAPAPRKAPRPAPEPRADAPSPEPPLAPVRRPPRAAAAPAAPAAAPEPPPPEPAGRFDSVFDARVDPDRPGTDALGNLVVAQRRRAPATLSPQPTEPATETVAGRWRLVLPAVLAAILLLSLATTWRYRAVGNRYDRAVAAAHQKVAEATWPGAVAAVNLLTEADTDPDLFARMGNGIVRAVGRPGLTARRGELIALLARIEAQRVATFGERDRRDALRRVLQRAQLEAADREDTTLAAAWQSLDSGQAEDARRELESVVVLRAGDAEVRYVAGVAGLQAGRPAEGVEHLRAALQANPGHVGALKALADHRAIRGEHTAALDAYKQILSTYSPDHLETRVALARLQIRLGKRESESMAELKGLSTDPTLSKPQHALVFDALGESALRRGDLQNAREAFFQAQASAPGDPRYAVGLAALDMRELKLDEAENVLTEAWRADPQNLLHLQYLVQLRLMRGDPEGALRRVDQASQMNAALLLLKGRALIELKDPKTAERILRQARDEDSGWMDVRIYRGLASYLMNRTPKALEELKNMRNRGEGDDRLEDRALPFRAYAEALAASDDRRGAAAAFQRALEIDHRDFLAAWGLCQLAMAEGDPQRALNSCRASVALNPHYLPAADQAAAIAEVREDYQSVIAVLAPLLARDPQHPAALRRLARAYIRTGDPDHAARLVDGDVTVEDGATQRYIRGLVGLAKGHLTEALTDLGAAADELTNEPWVQLARADALMRDGKTEGAGSFYRRALVAGAGAEAGLGAAKAWLLRERWHEAQVSATEALARAERDHARPAVIAQALALQAEALFSSGEGRGRGAAMAAIERALATAPNEAGVLLTAGRLAEAEGRAADAQAHYRRAVAARADSAEARYYLGRALLSTRDHRDEGRDALEQAARLDRDGRFGALADQLLRKRP